MPATGYSAVAMAGDEKSTLQAEEAFGSARRAARAASIFNALAMLIGAFIACISAALGAGFETRTRKHLDSELSRN